MNALPYKVSHPRGPNCVAANPERIESADGKRWACGRNVKAESMRGRGYYDVVQVWTTKRRDENNKAVVVDTGLGRDEANRWVNDN